MDKKCGRCKQRKLISGFNKNKSAKDGLGHYCKECSIQYQRDFREHNPEKSKQYSKEWFSKNKDAHRQTGKQWRIVNRERYNERVRNYRAKNPGPHRDQTKKSHLKREYGISIEQKQQMISAQNNCCAICLGPLIPHPYVDHIHGTNPVIVRGVLCGGCNLGLGHFKDSPERLIKAASYLQKFP